MNSYIQNYLESFSRNKIVFCNHSISGIEELDVGKWLSQEVKSFSSYTKVGLKTMQIIDEIFSSSILVNPKYGKCLAIKNIGILLEPELKIDFVQILDKYSSSNTLIVKWEGEIEDGILYFLTKEKGQKINIKNLSHIVI